CRDCRLTCVCVGNVCDMDMHVLAGHLCRLLERALVDVDRENGGALSHKPGRHRPADARAGTCDESHPVVEPFHSQEVSTTRRRWTHRSASVRRVPICSIIVAMTPVEARVIGSLAEKQ